MLVRKLLENETRREMIFVSLSLFFHKSYENEKRLFSKNINSDLESHQASVAFVNSVQSEAFCESPDTRE